MRDVLWGAGMLLALFAVQAGGAVASAAQPTTTTTTTTLAWPEIGAQQRAWARWWWMGSAVDQANLTHELRQLHDAGFGGVEVTPLYGAVGFESRYLQFLSPRYMEMLKFAATEARRLGMQTDMATGTGWPFGGPWIDPADADARVVRDGDHLASKPTRMKVKRAAPGDEGLVVNPYSPDAMRRYLEPFTKAFDGFPNGLIRAQFHDSFEYSGNWTDALPERFKAMHGYDLRDHVAEFSGDGDADRVARVKSDYRQTLGQLHLEYVRAWVGWSHEHGFLAREQAHGSPANLLDVYAAADIPESETFGSTPFPIPGFRRDAADNGTNVPSPLASRMASSAAHVGGHAVASCETFTWLREHFRASLAQMKPEADQMFVAGINHLIYHGACYSPADAAWPGWNFYASVEFNPRNAIWRDLPAMNAYVARCQSFLQSGEPDNDVLIYWPVYDTWNAPRGMEVRYSMHDMASLTGSPFGKTAQDLIDHGFAPDFVSDAQLLDSRTTDGQLQTPGGRYKVLVVPETKRMPVATLKQMIDLAEAGATVVLCEAAPADVPGLGDLERRRAAFGQQLDRLHFSGAADDGTRQANVGSGRIVLTRDAEPAILAAGATREAVAGAGVGFVRRRAEGGSVYFLANLKDRPLDGWVRVGTPSEAVAIFDPLTGMSGIATTRRRDGDATEVYLQLRPGQSAILRTFTAGVATGNAWAYLQPGGDPQQVSGQWSVEFIDGGPQLPAPLKTDRLASWTTLGDDEARRFAGTARYRIEFDLPDAHADDWLLDLGDVRESGRVKLNGRDVGTLWSLPFTTRVGQFLRPGKNVLEVEVTNLAANRIRDLDRSGVKWKAFHEINFVDVHYKPFDASNWPLTDSGLIGPVHLTPMRRLAP